MPVCVGAGPGPHPDVALGLLRAALDAGHVAQRHRPAAVQPHHQVADLLRPWTGRSRPGPGPPGCRRSRPDCRGSGCRPGARGAGRSRSMPWPARAWGSSRTRTAWRGRADGVDVLGAGDALDLLLDGVGHLAQLEGAPGGVLGPQGGGDDGDVVDALGFDDGGWPTPRLAGSQS